MSAVCLCCCSRLTAMSLQLPYSAGDEDMATLAGALPQLRALRFSSSPRHMSDAGLQLLCTVGMFEVWLIVALFAAAGWVTAEDHDKHVSTICVMLTVRIVQAFPNCPSSGSCGT